MDEPKYITAEEAEKLGIDEGSKKVKELAAQQKITIKLSQEQVEALKSQWKAADNSRPAEITFVVEGKTNAQFKVAAYGYFTDQCCV